MSKLDFISMSIGHRVTEARNYAGLSKTALAKVCGMSKQAVGQIENGTTKEPKPSNLKKIAIACGVNSDWIIDGSGFMVTAGTVNGTVSDSVAAIYNTHSAEDVSFDSLTPLISWIRAGEFCEAHDALETGDAEEWLPRPKGASKSTYALRVKGDSMTSPYPGSRSYPHGIIIFVDPEKEVLPGNRGVFKLPDSNEVTFKELVSDAGQLYLKPLNPQYDKIAVTQQMTACGKIIGSYFAE